MLPILRRMRLTPDVLRNPDVVLLARFLLGKALVHYEGNKTRVAIISETEAYEGETDRASHAWNGRRTPRTETMYQKGGIAYVYLCYGLHKMMNVVTHDAGIPHAILLRSAFIGESGNSLIQATRGPGRLGRVMGIELKHNGADLIQGKTLWLEDLGIIAPEKEIKCTPRIGIAYAGEHAAWLYRFVWEPGQESKRQMISQVNAYQLIP
jgi:DNA-3-methyladenine glycosylase